MKKQCLVAAALFLCALQATAEQDAKIPYPTGFREWAHVKSTIVGPTNPSFATNGGLHHFYANAKALEGYRSGSFPDGSILIDDLLEAKEGAAGVTAEGARRRLAVMVKDSARFADTGGWDSRPQGRYPNRIPSRATGARRALPATRRRRTTSSPRFAVTRDLCAVAAFDRREASARSHEPGASCLDRGVPRRAGGPSSISVVAGNSNSLIAQSFATFGPGCERGRGR
jgi:hypothetical protein